MTQTEIREFKRAHAQTLQEAPEAIAPSEEIAARLAGGREKLRDLLAQRDAFSVDLESEAEKEEVAVQRVRLRLDGADTITAPRAAVANLRALLPSIETEIEELERAIWRDEIALEMAQSIEALEAPARFADGTAREFHAKRNALALHLETELRALADLKRSVSNSETEFARATRAFADKFPVEIPAGHPALGSPPTYPPTQRARHQVSAENLVDAMSRRGIPTQNVTRLLPGFNIMGMNPDAVKTTSYGEAHDLAGMVNRCVDELTTPKTPIY